jgi:hypothetical protein
MLHPGKESPELLTNQNTDLSMQAFTATPLAVFFVFFSARITMAPTKSPLR